MKRRHLAGLALVALALAPGTWLRTEVSETPIDLLRATPVTDLPTATSVSGLTRTGVWHLTSPNIEFGGYSALLWFPGAERLRAFSDRGGAMTLPEPGGDPETPVRFTHVWNRGALSPTPPDLEAATRDPVSGDFWLAFEFSDSILRYDSRSNLEAVRQPPEWQHWPDNSGAEAIAYLPDGRFLVLPEGERTGFVYPGDPTGELAPQAFAFTVPGRYSPTDAEALPDGRVLVLLRHVTFGHPPFTSALGVLDTAQIGGEEPVAIEVFANLDTILPRENYEALASGPVTSDGRLVLWVMSDDNRASFQRTLLARLEFDVTALDGRHEKARED